MHTRIFWNFLELSAGIQNILEHSACPCDYRVSPSPFGLDFGTLDFGTSDSGLTIIFLQIVQTLPLICTMYIVQILLVELMGFHF